jgi:hypothetical protein
MNKVPESTLDRARLGLEVIIALMVAVLLIRGATPADSMPSLTADDVSQAVHQEVALDLASIVATLDRIESAQPTPAAFSYQPSEPSNSEIMAALRVIEQDINNIHICIPSAPGTYQLPTSGC